MNLKGLTKNKALPSFCTSNLTVLNLLVKFCKKNKLPLLIETTSSQVNQFGGYTNKTPQQFNKILSKLIKKEKFNSKGIFFGGDHLGPLPWKNFDSHKALKNSVKLIDAYLKTNYSKIHIDTSIKCSDDKDLSNDIVFQRTKYILKNLKFQKKLKNVYLVFGTEVPLSGGNDNSKIKPTSIKQVMEEYKNFKNLLQKKKLEYKNFGLVIEPGMKFMHKSITKPNLKKFSEYKKFSKKNNFVFEAHSTDYQDLPTLKTLVENNFKFLKVGPELTFYLFKSLIFMETLEKKFFKKKSNFQNIIFKQMLSQNKYWKSYHNIKSKNIKVDILNSNFDRTRYYFEDSKVKKSINILKENINKIDQEKLTKFLNKNKNLNNLNISTQYNLDNYNFISLCFLDYTFSKYYNACGFKTLD
jgi:D-tagatose-1,6-bisphosphate aldolase subunit GatZ/KbaZ